MGNSTKWLQACAHAVLILLTKLLYSLLSCAALCCRCADMPLSHLNRRRFFHVVGIIPGPKEPSNLDPYLENLVEEFQQYGPSGECPARTGVCNSVGWGFWREGTQSQALMCGRTMCDGAPDLNTMRKLMLRLVPEVAVRTSSCIGACCTW